MAHYDYELSKEICDKCLLPTTRHRYEPKFEILDHENCLVEGYSVLLREIQQRQIKIEESLEKIATHIGANHKDCY